MVLLANVLLLTLSPTSRAHTRTRQTETYTKTNTPYLTMQTPKQQRDLTVVVAGGGIGGLCTALVLTNQGYDVRVYEKATKYRPFGGPIQIASNAAESLRRIDADVYHKILQRSTIIGDRVNGLKDASRTSGSQPLTSNRPPIGATRFHRSSSTALSSRRFCSKRWATA